MKKIPKRVRIVANTGHEYYDRYIGEKGDVLNIIDEGDVIMFELDIPIIPAFDSHIRNTLWSEHEVEVVEWEEVDGYEIDDVIHLTDQLIELINRDEYDADEANELLLGIRKGLNSLKNIE